VLVLGASVGYFNAQTVRFNYLFGAVEMPLIALLIVDFILAVLISLAVVLVRMLGLRAEIRRLKKQVRDVETELKSLRNLPLQDAR
jgi:uncharacterized integral membrane protein